MARIIFEGFNCEDGFGEDPDFGHLHGAEHPDGGYYIAQWNPDKGKNGQLADNGREEDFFVRRHRYRFVVPKTIYMVTEFYDERKEVETRPIRDSKMIKKVMGSSPGFLWKLGLREYEAPHDEGGES